MPAGAAARLVQAAPCAFARVYAGQPLTSPSADPPLNPGAPLHSPPMWTHPEEKGADEQGGGHKLLNKGSRPRVSGHVHRLHAGPRGPVILIQETLHTVGAIRDACYVMLFLAAKRKRGCHGHGLGWWLKGSRSPGGAIPLSLDRSLRSTQELLNPRWPGEAATGPGRPQALQLHFAFLRRMWAASLQLRHARLLCPQCVYRNARAFRD